MTRRLPFVLLVLLFTAGCQTTQEREVPAPSPVAEPERLPLEAHWQASAGTSAVDAFVAQLRGEALRRAVLRAAATDSLEKAYARLTSAQSASRQARAVLSELYGYRRAGGVLLGEEEKFLWRRLQERLNAGAPLTAAEVALEMERARLSLAVQAARAWFHHQGIRRLREAVAAEVALRRQVVDRHRTASRLEGRGRERVLAARKELARAESRLKQLQKAEAQAARALMRLTGRKGAPRDGTAVSALPAGVKLATLAHRADLAAALEPLTDMGLEPAWPDLTLVARGEGVSRDLARLARLEPVDLAARLGLDAEGPQREAVLAFAGRLQGVLRQVRSLLYGIGRLQVQRQKLQTALAEAKRETNRLRARYSARRADLLEILDAQIRATDFGGRAAYVERRLQDQRAVVWMALGLPAAPGRSPRL